MKRILYLTNIVVPYKVRLLNELSRYCDLTVLYEREKSSNRNGAWAVSEEIRYPIEYLNGIRLRNEFTFSFRILKPILSKYDVVIISCYNSPVQMMASLVLRLLHIPYILSLDGEIFLKDNCFRTKLKRGILTGAKQYLVPGEKSAESLRSVSGAAEIVPYYFSSLTDQELKEHATYAEAHKHSSTILVVGQYFDYKGMDIALKAAKMDPAHHYKFIGMGNRTESFIKREKVEDINHVEVIPFLQRQQLEQEYQKCKMVILPSRQECWGLVINEAASYGAPIVATWGSGAAVEFLADRYPCFLAKPGDAEDLYQCIRRCSDRRDTTEYSRYLIEKSMNYSIGASLKAHLKACGIVM